MQKYPWNKDGQVVCLLLHNRAVSLLQKKKKYFRIIQMNQDKNKPIWTGAG